MDTCPVIDHSLLFIDHVYNPTLTISIVDLRPKLNSKMSIVKFVLVSGDFMGEWVETPKYWKWRSFTKVTMPIPVQRNSSYDEFVASVMQIGDLDYALSDVVISYLMYLREKVNHKIINNDVRVLTYAYFEDKYS
ncbi:hypothetical protein P3L10_033216 [Capsicum annuum]